MFRGIISQGIFGNGIKRATLVRHNSILSELRDAVKPDQSNTPNAQPKKQSRGADDIDTLLKSNLFDAKFLFGADINGSNEDPSLFSRTLQHPRDVAKSIRISGPEAGTAVDVRNGSIALTYGMLQLTLRKTNVRYLQNVQKRYIRPAKYRKQLKSEWWRRNFSKGFKDLMAQVRDAKRRGY
ncbi:uncharacterized protein KQ657_001042 [Scheffersomyces spartinae]|uniref:Uncharacterized protein n=1 Tax=Scheffersomyces spartinae TaxID=45513 RepID=A0A9P7V8S0_9ASCO|nr:uncharacterized protein KQ657_001042 [Scheffersomyces spartinae]KAG7193279.1 hypothetical protein KQ657_001042 [Scheffersomyces spartinae]